MSELTYKRLNRGLFCAYKDGKMVGYATYNVRGNYIDTLWVSKDLRRQGVGTGLVSHVVNTLGWPLKRCPDHLKNDAVRGLGAKFGDAIGPEAKEKRRR